MTAPASTADTEPGLRSRPSLARVLAAVAVITVGLYAVVSLVFVFRGRLNADEGWYLYAGRLVWRGNLPYRDFAFPQMPLTAYAYGLAQLVKPSLYLGRLTSFCFAVVAVGLCVRVAWREAGRIAAVAVGVLCVAFPTGIYNLTLTKTYALTAVLLAAILFALTSPARPERAWPLATAAAVALALTRTTGFPLTVLVIGFCLLRAPSPATRRRVIGVTVAGVALLVAFLLPDLAAARYNLFTFHNLLWHGAGTGSRLDTIVTDRTADWLGDYPGYVALVVVALGAIAWSKDVRAYLRRQPGVALVGIGILAALAVQLFAGEWAPVEYFSPVVPALLAVSIIVIARALGLHDPDHARPAWLGVFAAGVVVLAAVTLFHPGVSDYFTSSSDPGSVAAANRVGEYLHDHTRSGDEVLTMWAQPSGLVSTRDQVPGVTVGPFSYEDLPTAKARDLHFVNSTLLRGMLRAGRPAAVVITDIDRLVLGFTGTYSSHHADPRAVLGALDAHYHLAHRDVGFGTSGPIGVDVYLRNDRK